MNVYLIVFGVFVQSRNYLCVFHRFGSFCFRPISSPSPPPLCESRFDFRCRFLLPSQIDPLLLLLQVWMEVSQCIFDLVMEGYSKVRKVSPEGRSAMTMDVFALHDGLNSIHLCRYILYHHTWVGLQCV